MRRAGPPSWSTLLNDAFLEAGADDPGSGFVILGGKPGPLVFLVGSRNKWGLERITGRECTAENPPHRRG